MALAPNPSSFQICDNCSCCDPRDFIAGRFRQANFFGLNFSVWNSGHESKIASIGILFCTIFVIFSIGGLQLASSHFQPTGPRLYSVSSGVHTGKPTIRPVLITSYFTQNSKSSCDIVPQNSLKCLTSKGYEQGTDTRRNYNSPAVNYGKKKLHQPEWLDSTRDEKLFYSKCPEMYNVQQFTSYTVSARVHNPQAQGVMSWTLAVLVQSDLPLYWSYNDYY